MSISKSPNRNTFQKEAYVRRCEEEGRLPNPEYLKLYESDRQQMAEWDEREHEHDLEYDLRTTPWILEKVRASDTYAQNLYAAMCNREFRKLEVMPILTDQTWSCSWRHSGGIIADMQERGDYIDWYCSGMGDGLGNGDSDGSKVYVPEGHVTEEIAADLQRLGWLVLDADDR